VTNRTDFTVSRIDPRTNRVVATIKIGNRPQGIAAGHGAVWVSAA
jgi:YVTN family beta-propeller protein